MIHPDYQYTPELIPAMIDKWRAGYHVVYAQRTARQREGPAKKLFAYFFYRVLRLLTNVDMPAESGSHFVRNALTPVPPSQTESYYIKPEVVTVTEATPAMPRSSTSVVSPAPPRTTRSVLAVNEARRTWVGAALMSRP